MHLLKEFVKIERRRETALLALDQRCAQGFQSCLLFLHKAQTSSHHILGGLIAAIRHLFFDELVEVST